MGKMGYVLAAAAGAVVALQLRPSSESSCCNRVRGAVADELRDAVGGGFWGDALVGLAGATGLLKESPALLDALGVSP